MNSLMFVGSRLKLGHSRILSLSVSSIYNASGNTSMSHIAQSGSVLSNQIQKHQSLSNGKVSFVNSCPIG